MSKKSTQKNGSDGDAYQNFANDSVIASETRKDSFDLQKEESTSSYTGDSSSTHQIIKPLQLNTDISVLSNQTSGCSLDFEQDLYETNEAFNKNLDFLRKKLCFLNLESPTDSNSSNGECGQPLKQPSARNAFLNYCSAREGFSPECAPHLELTQKISTIYEGTEEERPSTNDSYMVPSKKACLRREVIPVIFKSSEINFSCQEDEFKSDTPKSNGTGYIVPFKKQCRRKNSPKFNVSGFFNFDIPSTRSQISSYKKIRNLGGVDSPALSFRTRHEEEDSSCKNSELLELGLNLPSSTAGDDWSSNKTTPIEPNVVIIDTSERKSNLFKRTNRVEPLSREGSSSRPVKTSRSSDLNDYLRDRYYKDTSEFSNDNSTPPCKDSTRSSSFSPILLTNKEEEEAKRSICDQFGDRETFFDHKFTTGLAVPRMSMRSLIFPAFTKITLFPKHFLQQYEGGNFDECKSDQENIPLSFYWKQAANLLQPSDAIPARRKTDTIFKNRLAERKIQAIEMTYYSISSNSSLNEDLGNVKIKTDDEIPPDDTEWGFCCCLKTVFSNRWRNLFT